MARLERLEAALAKKAKNREEKERFVEELMAMFYAPSVDRNKARLAYLLARVKGWDMEEFEKRKVSTEEKSANIRKKTSAELFKLRQQTRRLGRAGKPRNEPEYDFTGSADDQGNGTTGGEGEPAIGGLHGAGGRGKG